MRLTIKIPNLGLPVESIKAKAANPTPLYDDILEYLLGDLDRRWDAEVDERGHPWKKLTDDYREWKKKKRPNAGILVFDEHMKKLNRRVTKDGLRIYTQTNAQDYAERQALNRSYLGVSAENLEEFSALTVDFFRIS